MLAYESKSVGTWAVLVGRSLTVSTVGELDLMGTRITFLITLYQTNHVIFFHVDTSFSTNKLTNKTNLNLLSLYKIFFTSFPTSTTDNQT